MSRPVLAVTLAALSMAVAAAAQEPAWGSVPSRLVVEPSEVDLGEVRAGLEAVATFHLKNPGEREVRILAARPS